MPNIGKVGEANRTRSPGAIIKSKAPSLATLWEGALRAYGAGPRGRSLAGGEMGLSTAVAVVIGSHVESSATAGWPAGTRPTHSRRWSLGTMITWRSFPATVCAARSKAGPRPEAARGVNRRQRVVGVWRGRLVAEGGDLALPVDPKRSVCVSEAETGSTDRLRIRRSYVTRSSTSSFSVKRASGAELASRLPSVPEPTHRSEVRLADETTGTRRAIPGPRRRAGRLLAAPAIPAHRWLTLVASTSKYEMTAIRGDPLQQPARHAHSPRFPSSNTTRSVSICG